MAITLVTGGTRSGKSYFAVQQALTRASKKRYFIATAVAFDEEMDERIKKHKDERGTSFTTVEAPYDLSPAIDAIPADASIILIDCLTVWIGNLMYKFGNSTEKITTEVSHILDSLNKKQCDCICVTNEVGMGIVPENSDARFFRDLSGMANRSIASVADEVFFCVCGISQKIKPLKE